MSSHAHLATLAPSIRLPKVCDLLGTSSATVWRMCKSDPSFPRPYKLSTAITCWDQGELLDWVAAKKAERGAL